MVTASTVFLWIIASPIVAVTFLSESGRDLSAWLIPVVLVAAGVPVALILFRPHVRITSAARLIDVSNDGIRLLERPGARIDLRWQHVTVFAESGPEYLVQAGHLADIRIPRPQDPRADARLRRFVMRNAPDRARLSSRNPAP
jgi:hypothetical protein